MRIDDMPICVKCDSPGKKKKYSTYGPTGGKATHCPKHGKECGHVDVVSKRCEDPKCEKFATHGPEGGKTRTRCSKHGKELGLVDVVSKWCEDPRCKKHATCGDPDGKWTRCADHKAPGMINVKSKKCEHHGCKAQANCGDPEKKQATHCADHKSDAMINVKSNRCVECSHVHVARKGDFCATCDVKINGATRIMRVKEKNMIAAIQYILELGKSIYGIEIKYNESIGKAYGSYRPDIHINCGTFIIVIECDEFQHKPRYIKTIKRKIGADGDEVYVAEGRPVTNYDESREVKRMISIQSSRGLPCHIIRLNPDPFKIGGVTANVPIEERYAALCDQLKLALSTPPSSDLVVMYMYYDNDDSFIRTRIVPILTGCVVDL